MGSVRQFQLEESISVRRFLIEETRMMSRKIDLHSTQLKRLVRKLKLEKFALLRNPKRRRFLRLNPETRRWRMRMTVHHDEDEYTVVLKPSPNSKIIKPRTSCQYKPIDGYQYGISFLVRREENNWVFGDDENENDNDNETEKDIAYHEDSDNKETLMMRYSVTLKFMYKLRNGLFIQQESVPWDIPFAFACVHKTNKKCNIMTGNDIPVGLAALINGLGIPDTCRDAMFRDICRFGPPNPTASCSNVLYMEINITTLQLEGEDVLETQLRANVDQICRSQYIDNIILKNDANLQPLSMVVFEEEEEQVEDCCSICLEELGGSTADLPCSHVYHYDCIFKWMFQYNFCPLCRRPYQRLFHPLKSLYHLTAEVGASK